MYVQCSTIKRSGKDGRNRKLVESYRDKATGQPRNRTVQKLEKLPILERSRLILKYGGQKYLDAEEWKVLMEAGDFTQPKRSTFVGDSYTGAGNWVLLEHARKSRLGFILNQHLGNKFGNIVMDMITLQILNPDSKHSYAQKREGTLNYVINGKQSYSEDLFYSALDILAESFSSIRASLNEQHPPSGKLLLYDLSNSYFCGRKAELGGYGESKEKRHDRYIVSYGLVTGQDGLPLDIQVWKGGTADVKTVTKTFTDWESTYHSSQAIWIADRAMSDDGTLASVKDMGLSYITGLPASSQIALLENIQENCPELFDEQLTEFKDNDKRYILCRHHQKGYRRQAKNHQNLRKVYQGLKKIKESPQNTNKEKLYHRAMKVLENYNQTKCWELSFEIVQDKKGKDRYILVYRLNRQQFKALNIIGHYYVLQTDLSSRELTRQEAQQYYKSLLKVERCFRIAKSSLEIRPIRHRKANRIKSHIYLCFLGLWLTKYIEKKWREKGVRCDIPTKLKQWDKSMMLHEILESKTKHLVELQWNKGPQATNTFQELVQMGEMEGQPPHL